jgi:rhomboid protease GluP
VLTRVLIAINVIVYAWERTTGALTTDRALEAHGALVGVDVLAGEWWRIFTAAFLHGSDLHILFNMFALWQVGNFIESVMGAPRMLAIYLISALGSGLLVTYATPTSATVGASGAIFGLFGAIVALGLRLGPQGGALVRQSVGVIVLNLLIGFTVPNISNAGHIGGLIAGFLSGMLLYRPPRTPRGPAYAPAQVDLQNEPGVTTIEQRPDEPEPRP